MLFVTVGTHEQQFDRLVRAVDELKSAGEITQDVVIQTGYSDYVPQACTYSRFYPYQDMLRYVAEARIVITHGAPSSYIMALQDGKIPIVVPRRKEFGEHVNDHQLEFCRAVRERQGNILLVEDIADLAGTIRDYDSLTAALPAEQKSHNAEFCAAFSGIVDELLPDGEPRGRG